MNDSSKVLAKAREIIAKQDDGRHNQIEYIMDNALLVRFLVDVVSELNDRVISLEKRLNRHGLW